MIKRCEEIPVWDDTESSVELVEHSTDHMKVIALIHHLTQHNGVMVNGHEVFVFMAKCSELGLRFRLLDSFVENFDQVLETRINSVVFDLWDLALIDTEESEEGAIIAVRVFEDIAEFYLSKWDRGEQELLESAVRSINYLSNTSDVPLLVIDPVAKRWVKNF